MFFVFLLDKYFINTKRHWEKKDFLNFKVRHQKFRNQWKQKKHFQRAKKTARKVQTTKKGKEKSTSLNGFFFGIWIRKNKNMGSTIIIFFIFCIYTYIHKHIWFIQIFVFHTIFKYICVSFDFQVGKKSGWILFIACFFPDRLLFFPIVWFLPDRLLFFPIVCFFSRSSAFLTIACLFNNLLLFWQSPAFLI